MNYVLPGMGATNAMFSGPWQSLEDTRFLDWPKHGPSKDIPRLADYLISEYGIQAEDSLIGTSFGGIVACEIANKVPLHLLVLIGGATSKTEINPLLNLPSPMIDLAPVGFFIKVAGKIDSQLTEMFSQSDPAFIRTMSKSIFQWNGLREGIKPFRIHGLHDHVIPKPDKVDLEIDGGHLIAMTHADDCVAAIRKLLF